MARSDYMYHSPCLLWIYPSIYPSRNLAWRSMRMKTPVYQYFIWQSLVSYRDTQQQQSLREIWPVSPLHYVHISMAYFSALGHIIASGGSRDSLLGWSLGTRFGAWFYTWTTFQLLHTNPSEILHFRHFIEMHGHWVLVWWMNCFVKVISYVPYNQIPCLTMSCAV